MEIRTTDAKVGRRHAWRATLAALVMALCVVIGLSQSNALAAEADSADPASTSQPATLGDPGEYYLSDRDPEGFTGATFTAPVYIWVNGERQVAYCINSDANWAPPLPGNPIFAGTSIVYDEERYLADGIYYHRFDNTDLNLYNNKSGGNGTAENLRAVLYCGYPNDAAGVQGRLGLTDEQFRAVTQAAVWKYCNRLSMNAAKYNLGLNGWNGWTDAMTDAYNVLIDASSEMARPVPPSDFNVDLYLADDANPKGTWQGLVSSGLTVPARYNATTLRIPVTKWIQGIAPDGAVFDFTLSAITDGAPMPDDGTNILQVAAEKTGYFGDITFTAPGTYVYQVTEVEGTIPDCTYDTTPHVVEITVSAAADGTLSTACTIDGLAADEDGVIITNRFSPEPAKLTVAVQKVLEGDVPATDETFTFKLEPCVDGMPAVGYDGEVATVTGAGETQFGEVTVYEPGTYTWKVTEVNGGAAGYAYDGTTYYVTVVAKDEGGAIRFVRGGVSDSPDGSVVAGGSGSGSDADAPSVDVGGIDQPIHSFKVSVAKLTLETTFTNSYTTPKEPAEETSKNEVEKNSAGEKNNVAKKNNAALAKTGDATSYAGMAAVAVAGGALVVCGVVAAVRSRKN